MNIKLYISMIIGVFGVLVLHAQAPNLILEVAHDAGELELKWYPMDATLWAQANEAGYQIERWQLNDNGDVLANTQTTIVRTPAIQPKDSLWFVENAAIQNYYISALGTMLYDPDFKQESDVVDAAALRYNYLLREALYTDNTAAEALGLYFRDSTMTDGLRYRYRVFAVQNGKVLLEATTDMQTESGVFYNQPTTTLDIDLPDGKSITDMSGRLNVPIDFVALTAKAYGDSIVLRWGPNSPEFWNTANEQGYLLMRMEYVEDGVNIDSLGIIKPWSKDSLSMAIADDDMALVAAQSLYGAIDTPPENMVEEATLYENRHSFALFAAERSQKAANLLGLRYVDTAVEEGATYTYYVNSPASTYPMSGRTYELKNVYEPDPEPFGLEAKALDGVIALKWDKERNDAHFSGYYLERSDDGGKTFTPLNEQLLVFLEDERVPMEFYSYLDSLDTNYKEYIYRLRGLTSFADISPAAEVVAEGVDLTPPPIPVVYHATLSEDLSTMTVKWRMPSLVDDMAGYKVLLGEGNIGDFDTLQTVGLKDSLVYRYTVTDGTDKTHFFKILVYDKADNYAESEAAYIHYPDLVPPDSPTNLIGEVNDEGIVTLAWDHSTAEDLEGYWIYYTHAPEELLVPINGKPVLDNFFRDTIPLKTLNKVIYYTVRSQDDNYNRSEFSDMLELARPDVIPPQKPLLKEPIGLDSLIVVSWFPSVSEDVEYYELQKRIIAAEEEWQSYPLISADTTLGYIDAQATYDEAYEYRVRAIDYSGNESDFSMELSGKLVFDSERVQVSDFEVQYDEASESVKIAWDFEPPTRLPSHLQNYEFYLFKSLGGADVKEFQRINGTTTEFTDTKIETEVLYNYAIMVVYNSGMSSALSDVKSLLIE